MQMRGEYAAATLLPTVTREEYTLIQAICERKDQISKASIGVF